MPKSQKRRAVIVGGVRTPFVKAFKEFIELDSIDLADAAVKGLMDRYAVPRDAVDSIVWGGVILPSAAPNIAREIALDLGLPSRVEGMTVTRACASGLQAVTLAAAAIERGEYDCAIAGGSDSTSNGELKMPQKFVRTVGPVVMGGKATPADYLQLVAQLAPFTDLLPRMPKIAERTTGQVMGEAAEDMAKRNEISRVAQDEFTVASHHRAAAAISSGRFDDEVTPVQTRKGAVYTDSLVRGDTSVEKLAKLRPVFARSGTLTAGNSSPLTDGASAVLLMSEDKARALGYRPKAAFRSWAYRAVDPADQLLMGPALAMPAALDAAGLTLKDIGLVDMHEAFAAQVLSVLKMLGSDAFAKMRLGRSKAIGTVDFETLNVHGGSIALGHPFGATGARMVTTMANELEAGQHETALLGICAAGGLGAAAVLERVA
ncbi:MAG: acetyl-CoA C-acyltransferase [Myxococcota bacterium]|nr:acetyl-CoA C-acyltransferase [Myxococcota bacterium]